MPATSCPDRPRAITRANRAEGDRARQVQQTPAVNASVRTVAKADDYKRSLSNVRTSVQPAGNGSAKPRSHDIIVITAEEDTHGDQKNRAKPKAQKNEPETVGRGGKPEDHKNGVISVRRPPQPAGKRAAKPRL